MRGALRSALLLSFVSLPSFAAASTRAAIEAENKKFVAAATAKDAAALGKMYAPDAEILPPGHPIVKGREEITKFWKAAMDGFKLETLTTQEVHPAGNLVIEVGGWTGSTPDGKSAAGKYMVVWRHDGAAWHLYRDMWSDNGAPPAAAASASAPAPAAAAPAPAPAKATTPAAAPAPGK
jgi:ketosteroid isomerase-like protein